MNPRSKQDVVPGIARERRDLESDVIHFARRWTNNPTDANIIDLANAVRALDGLVLRLKDNSV